MFHTDKVWEALNDPDKYVIVHANIADDVPQANLDKLKTQDGTAWNPTVTTNGIIEQILVELDLTPLCNKLFGGSNSALKAAFKAVNVDVWAMGSGANAGVLTNGVSMKVWYNNTSWVDWNSSALSTISKMSGYAGISGYINSANKVYILVASQYASDGTIASSVSLDYLNIRIDLARTPDTVQPISINLPKYWAMVVKGFSPSWTNATVSIFKYLFYIVKADNTSYRLYINPANNTAYFFNHNGSATQNSVTLGATIDTKYQIVSMLVEVTGSNLVIRILKNNGTVVKSVVAKTYEVTGMASFYSLINVNTQQADALSEAFHLVDLARIGKQNGFTDAEADSILRGVLPNPLSIQNPELFDINKVQLHANAIRSNGVITLNASAGYQESVIYIPVLPNNQYKIIGQGTGRLVILEKYNNILISQHSSVLITDGEIFTTKPNVNKISVKLTNTTAGTFTFSNISLRRKD
jgi:hypothetical protein